MFSAEKEVYVPPIFVGITSCFFSETVGAVKDSVNFAAPLLGKHRKVGTLGQSQNWEM